jgi:hypothetical protein
VHSLITLSADLCDSFYILADWVWDRRGVAKQAGFPFSEETITETILLDLKAAHPTEIIIVPLNKHYEGKFGADWEWCFTDSILYKPMLIQAKVLNDIDAEYNHIDRKIGNSDVRQIDRLIETASKRNVPALYAFYNHLSDKTRLPPSVKCPECWGIAIAPAEDVRRLLPDKTFDTLKTISTSWCNLVCRSDRQAEQPTDLPTKVHLTLDELLEASDSRLKSLDRPIHDRETQNFRPTNQAPNYVSVLRDLRGIDSADTRQRLIQSLSAQNPDLDGIVMISQQRE